MMIPSNLTRVDSIFIRDAINVINNGYRDENPRPKYADGTPAHTLSINHVIRSYDLIEEFPILTLRPIPWKSAIKEILWIYQDQSNSLRVLNGQYGIHYWDQWESKDFPGTIGVRYGETVRRHDLINKLFEDIKSNPYGRRHIMTLWQEDDFARSDGLLPCCYETIWNVRKDSNFKTVEYLDMMLIQRSGDMLAASGAGGVNEVQYAALQIMVSTHLGYKPGKFTHVVANEQIYDRHIDAIEELKGRYLDNLDLNNCDNYKTYASDNKVKMDFNPKSNNFYDFTVDDFEIVNYNPIKPQIKFELGI